MNIPADKTCVSRPTSSNAQCVLSATGYSRTHESKICFSEIT